MDSEAKNITGTGHPHAEAHAYFFEHWILPWAKRLIEE